MIAPAYRKVANNIAANGKRSQYSLQKGHKQRKIDQADAEQERRLKQQPRWLKREVHVDNTEQHRADAVTCVKPLLSGSR
jgi:hypothetical protein